MRLLNWLRKLLFRPRVERAQHKDILDIEHIRNGKVIARRHVEDLIPDVGLAGIAGVINGALANVFKYIAIGTGTTAPANGDTTLEAEITTGGGERAEGIASRMTTTTANDTTQVEHTFTFTAGFAVTEAGLLESAAAGVLGARQTFAVLNVEDGDGFKVTERIVNARG